MIGVIVVTHLDIATHMIEAAVRVMGPQAKLEGLDLRNDDSLSSMTGKILERMDQCRQSGEACEGILVLTDLFGSTPTNASLAQLRDAADRIEILTGVNLPMLISALTYRGRMTLKELSTKVMYDGQRGIRDAKSILLSRV